MLVLSRKESDRIVFPTVGITVEVLRIQGNTTRIGIDAPAEIPIYRHELVDLKSVEFSSDEDPKQKLNRLARTVRDRLGTASVALNRLHEHLDDYDEPAMQNLILEIYRELRALDGEANEVVEADEKCVASALLVEADANERGLLAGYLQLRGIETTTAKDGQDALDYLSLHSAPDVVLFDMTMPRCNGPCLVKGIRSNSNLNGVKLIAISQTDPCSFGVPTGIHGIDRWYRKPVNPDRLVDGIVQELGVDATAI